MAGDGGLGHFRYWQMLKEFIAPEREDNPMFPCHDSVVISNGIGDRGAPLPMNFPRDNWINPRDRMLDGFPENQNFPFLSEGHNSYHNSYIPSPPENPKLEHPKCEDSNIQEEIPTKKRPNGRACKAPKEKKSRKSSPPSKYDANCSASRPKPNKIGFLIDGLGIDVSGIPIPVCSCTGAPQQCYRWGCGGWQSACCTTSISIYPLPLSTKRRGVRISGRKMSQGAFKKVLEKLMEEGYNLSNPIDLKAHWAKHGTNKFVTIR